MKYNLNIPELQKKAAKIRGRVIEISHRNKIAHLASSLSCVDILTVLYGGVLNINPANTDKADRDRFILSKGHAATALYSTLSEFGFIDDAILDTVGDAGSRLEEHPSLNCIPGVEASTGSLGHGLPVGVGMAMASGITKTAYNVFVLMSDGECNEGSVWEAAMFAGGQKLKNLTVIIDFNKWQATGRSCEVMALEPLAEKWKTFGWDAYEIQGNSITDIADALNKVSENREKPVALIAHTIKGKGVSFMEDDNNWHYRTPTEEELMNARKELGLI